MLAPDSDPRKLSISFQHHLDTPEWNAISELKGSVLSGAEEESLRRQSLFADAESQLTKIMSGGSSADGGGGDERPQEVVFTDKARAAMVVIGTKDIKEALDRKKAVEVFRRTPEARNAAIFFQQARFLRQQGRYREAVRLVNKAVEVDPLRKEWLTERSYCYFKLLQPETALKHIDEVIKIDPKYFQALLLKGEILFSMWDLERAMLCFVEGRRLRPDNLACIRGVHKVRMALEEISAYRVSITTPERKTKFKRSKSAKERLVSSPVKSLLSSKSGGASNQRFSPDLDEASSALSTDDEDVARIRSSRTAEQRKSEYSKLVLMRMPTSETKTSSETARSSVLRPKTAIGQRKRSSTLSPSKDRLKEAEAAERYGSQHLLSVSPQSGSSLRLDGRSSGSNESEGDSSHKNMSSSGEDTSSISQPKRVRHKTKRRPRGRETVKLRPTSCAGPKVAASLEKDRVFLEGILKNRGLRKANTSFTKKAVRIAQDLYHFVKEREEYWSNRERFIRFSKQEDIFIA